MENKKVLSEYVGLEDYKKTFELMLGEACEYVKVSCSPDDSKRVGIKIAYKLTGISRMENRYVIFTHNDEDNLPNHYIAKTDDNFFDFFEYLTVVKFKIFGSATEVQNSQQAEKEANRDILDMFLCKELKEKYKYSKTALQEVERLENRANGLFAKKQDRLNQSKQNIKNALDLGK